MQVDKSEIESSIFVQCLCYYTLGFTQKQMQRDTATSKKLIYSWYVFQGTQSNCLLLESCCTISQDMEALVFVFFSFCIFIYLLIRLFI